MISPGDNFRIVYESHPSTQNHTHRRTHNQYDNCPSFKVSCCARQTSWVEWVGWLEWLMSNRCQAMTDVSTRDAVCSWGWCFAHWSTRAFHAVWVCSNNINCHNNNKINRNTCHAEVKDKKTTTEDICTTCLSWQWCARQCVFQQNQCKVLCLSHRSV